MTAPWKKAIRDFWLERTRTTLVVLAIAAGITAFSTVLSSHAILTRELDRSYLGTNPASATLWVERIDDAMLAALRANPEIAAVEARRSLRWRIRTGPMRWRPMTLFVIDDFARLRVSTLAPERGAWPPATGEILIERDAVQVAKTGIGRTVSIKDTSGREHELRVSGTVHDVGQAQARMENMVYAYVSRATLARLGVDPHLDQLKIVVARNRFDAAHIRRVVASLGIPTRRVEVPAPGRHPHADIMGVLFAGKLAFGLLVLALSGVIVVNLLTALMASQVRQIGVMQAVGGTRAQIARVYFSQALLLGLAALAIAIPAGMWGTRLLTRYQTVLLNYDVRSWDVPWWVYALDAIVGLLVPLAAAAVPVWKGSGIPVREALSDYGVSQRALGNGLLDRAVLRIGGAARPLVMSIRNAFRRRTRLVLTVLTLATAGLFFMVALNVRASLIHTLDLLFGQQRYDLSVALAEPTPTEKVERAIRATPGVTKAEYWSVSEGPGLTMLAMPAGSPLVAPNIVAGRALRAGDVDVMVVNSALASRLRIGQRSGRFTVVGIVREPFAPAVAYVPKTDSRLTNSLRLVLAGDDIDRVKLALEQSFRREGIATGGSNSKSEMRYGFDQHMLMIYVFLVVMSAVILGVGGLGLMTTLSLNVLERRREMGVLRAIGATPRAVWLMIVTEGLAIALLAWVLASLTAWPVSKAIGQLMVREIDVIFDLRGLGVWLAASLALGAIASFLPAWNASRTSVHEALM
jgi:putative ABC transport system permease protein